MNTVMNSKYTGLGQQLCGCEMITVTAHFETVLKRHLPVKPISTAAGTRTRQANRARQISESNTNMTKLMPCSKLEYWIVV